jgi:hypothetical protein
MSRVIYAFAHSDWDRALLDYLQAQGESPLLLAPTAEIVAHFPALATLPIDALAQADEPDAVLFQQLSAQSKDTDTGRVVLHAIGGIADSAAASDPTVSQAHIEAAFLTAKYCCGVLREFEGSLCYPLLSDAYAYVQEQGCLHGHDSITCYGIDALQKSLAKEWCGYPVRVNSLALPLCASDDTERKTLKRAMRNSVYGAKPAVMLREQVLAEVWRQASDPGWQNGQTLALRPAMDIKL